MKKKFKGFTLIELIIVISIIGIVSFVGIAGYKNYNQVQILQTAASDVTTTLNLAKSRALSQVKQGSICTSLVALEGYEVRIIMSAPFNRYRLIIHCGGLEDTISGKTLPRDVFFNPAGTSPNSFFFPVLTGRVDVGGQIALDGYGQTNCITVNSAGIITQSLCTAPPTPMPTATPTLIPPATPTLMVTPTPSPIPASPLYKRVFVTSTKYNGNLGGLLGADSKCQTSANTSGLGGTWKAWLSSSTTSAASRLTHAIVEYKLLNNITVASNWADLTDGTLINPIDRTETGGFGSSSFVWTNTNISGAVATGASICNNWSSGSGGSVGRAGNNASNISTWTNVSDIGCNGATSRLYCFEQ